MPLPGHADPPPKDASTLLLLDRTGRTKVLMGKRRHGHVFLPGKFLFPAAASIRPTGSDRGRPFIRVQNKN